MGKLVTLGLSALLIGSIGLSGAGCLEEYAEKRAGAKQRMEKLEKEYNQKFSGEVKYIGFVKSYESASDSLKADLDIFHQYAGGGQFLSGGGDIHNNFQNDRGVVIRYQPFDSTLTPRTIYVRCSKTGTPASILLDFIQEKDTIKVWRKCRGSTEQLSLCDPEDIEKLNK